MALNVSEVRVRGGSRVELTGNCCDACHTHNLTRRRTRATPVMAMECRYGLPMRAKPDALRSAITHSGVGTVVQNEAGSDRRAGGRAMLVLKWLLILLAVAVLGVVGAGQAGLFRSSAPVDLGVQGGKLKPPSATDNSVTSQAGLYPDHPQRQASQISPIALRGDGPTTIARIRAIVQAMSGATIVKSEADYLYAQFTTPLMKFVDDTEFWFDPAAQVIQVRSASRVGEGDMGVNRKRIESVRAALGASP